MRIAVWGPLPPAPSEIAHHTADLLLALTEQHEVVAVVEDPATVDRRAVSGVTMVGRQSVPETDLDVYPIGTSADCTFVYRAALERPGVVVLHEWVLHDLVWREGEERNDLSAYRREMRRSHGGEGSFVAHLVCRGRGGAVLPSLFAVNDRLLEGSLGVATLTREAGARLRRRHPRLPHLDLETAADRLAGFLVEVQKQRGVLLQSRAGRAAEGTLTAYMVDEVRQAARELGVETDGLGFESLLAPLAETRRP